MKFKLYLSKIFDLQARGTSIKTECLAGLSTFATMVYVVAVNPSILADSGMDFGAVLVATILSTAFATAFMGLWAHFPVAIAPAMGVSAFFTYSIVVGQNRPWQAVLAVACLVALTLVIFHLFHLRRKILEKMPSSLSRGITGGIGLFLACVGLKEIGLIDTSRLFISFGHVNYLECSLLALGVFIALILMRLKIKGAFIVAILSIWALALTLGIVPWQGIVSLPPSLLPTLGAFDFSSIWSIQYLQIFFSLFLVALFDSCAGLLVLARQAGLTDPAGKIMRAQRALLPDALGSLLASFLGSATLAIHLESASGIKAGGRTGLTALVVSFLFVLCLFFYPLISSIPHFASAPVLMILGGIMLREALDIPWKDLSESIPAVLATVTMPLTMSIYNGFLVGFLAYPIAKTVFGKAKDVPALLWVFFLAFALQLSLDVFL